MTMKSSAAGKRRERERPVLALSLGCPSGVGPEVAVLAARDCRLAVARRTGGHEKDFLELELVERGARHREMRVVNRVEGPAQYSYAQVRISPCPRTTYFCVVRPSSPTGPRACSLSVEMPISAPRPYS